MASTSEIIAELARLLERAAAAHHRAFAATPMARIRAGLTAELGEVDAEHRLKAPAVPWPSYYAGRLVARHLPT